MRYNLLANYYHDIFSNAQPEIKKEESIIDEVVFRSPFVTSETIFTDVLPTIESDRFAAISLIGPQGKGKTTLAAVFGTLAEDNDFLVIYGKSEDILPDLEAWVAKVVVKLKYHGNHKICFIMDDMSYSTGGMKARKAADFKHFIADIRHVFEKALSLKENTLEIFMIYNSHRLHSLPPMLRNSGSWIFAAMQAADREDALDLIPKQKTARDRLDALYSFIGKVSVLGPKHHNLNLNFGANTLNFVWGTKDDPGDGRLMVSYHAGEIRIFNSKKINGLIDLDSPEYRFRYTPPSEEEIKEVRAEKLRKAAEKRFGKNDSVRVNNGDIELV